MVKLRGMIVSPEKAITLPGHCPDCSAAIVYSSNIRRGTPAVNRARLLCPRALSLSLVAQHKIDPGGVPIAKIPAR